VLLAGHVIWFYLGKLVWPSNLIFTYPHWTIDTRVWWQYLYPAFVVVLAIGLLVLARWNRGPLAGFLIFVGTLVPALGFVDVYPFRYSYVADHFQYLASLGVIVPAAAAIAWGAGRFRLGRDRSLAVAGVFLVIAGSLSWRQSHMYKDAETLYRETLARNPASWMAHNNLGLLLAEQPDRLPEAMREFEAARRIKPDAAEVHVSLGSGLAHLPDRLPDAMAEFQTALRLRPDYADAHYGLGTALAHTPGRLADAISEYKAALRLDPSLVMAHLNLGNALVESGRLMEAIGEYQEAVRIRPDYAEAHYNLGSALAQMPGRQREAIGEFQTALAIRPDLEQAREAIEALVADEH
jgi:protein O-mannosyl-transferase